MPNRYIDPAPQSAYYPGSVNKEIEDMSDFAPERSSKMRKHRENTETQTTYKIPSPGLPYKKIPISRKFPSPALSAIFSLLIVHRLLCFRLSLFFCRSIHSSLCNVIRFLPRKGV